MSREAGGIGDGERDKPLAERVPINARHNKPPTAMYSEPPDCTPLLTPITAHGDMWVKRDDLYCMAGIRGGKVRACWHLATHADRPTGLGITSGTAAGRVEYLGLITASSRASPQAQIVARLAARLGIKARLHMPQGKYTEEMVDIEKHGGEIIQHKAGYNNVIIARALEEHKLSRGWRYIPFGMEHPDAMDCTRRQVREIPEGVKRIVMVLGSGMTAAGVLWGMKDAGLLGKVPLVGVSVGADPTKRLDKFAPHGWRQNLTIIKTDADYHTAIHEKLGRVLLDPHYEAKVVRYLAPGDLFWVVGIRAGLE